MEKALGSQEGEREMRRSLDGTHTACPFIKACVMIGDIDIVAPIETAFFCLSYAMVNITCFVLGSMGAPNWRYVRPPWYNSGILCALLRGRLSLPYDPSPSLMASVLASSTTRGSCRWSAES